MLYNMEKKKTITIIDCLTCPCYNKIEKKCEGLGKICNEIDPLTNTIIDNITGLPINLNKGEENGEVK